MLGIRGTPAFFINGRPISGAQQYQVFASMIEEELEAAQQSTEDTSETS
jgi:predicted DsbA family dithiol-disulfide isomerase